MMLAKKVVLRRVPPRDMSTGAWHQDGAFMGVGIRSLNIWLSLSHCGDEAPGLDVVGRRLDELVETGGEGTFNAWATNPQAAERVGAGAVVRPIFEPGDALLLDHLTLHRTAANAGMTKDRYVTENVAVRACDLRRDDSSDGRSPSRRTSCPFSCGTRGKRTSEGERMRLADSSASEGLHLDVTPRACEHLSGRAVILGVPERGSRRHEEPGLEPVARFRERLA